MEEVKIGAFEKEILKLDETKVLQNTDLTTTIIKESIDIFAKFLYTRKNSAIRFASFPFFSKQVDVTFLHKRGRKDMNENFSRISILSALSKMFEKCIFP